MGEAGGSSGDADVGAEEEVPCAGASTPAPAPGVMGPLVPGSGGGAWGVGASGTEDC